LERDRFASQLRCFLKGYFIDSASIPGFGLGRKSVLASYGIETAADISVQNLRPVPGIGVKRAKELMAWRKQIETQFVFNPTQGVSQVQIASLKQEYTRKRQMLEKELKNGVADLKQLSEGIIAKRKLLERQMQDSALKHAQTSADLAVLS
jgi:DNA-binding helix-hairpin-helix protein with protein kinase domain